MVLLLMMMIVPLLSYSFLPRYKIEHIYTYKRPREQQMSQEYKDEALYHILCKLDPDIFPSASQSRKAIEHGRLVVSRAHDCYSFTSSSTSEGSILDSIASNVGAVADSSTTLHDGDVIAIRSRLDNDFYPQSCTKYVHPPRNFQDFLAVKDPVLFEDDHIAIVNKPGGLDCIGEKRSDLQSILPFVLRPPCNIVQKNKSSSQCYLPRPVHRLDRKTSGCVMVAKSKNAMRQFSHLFASRQVQKSYCAVTFGIPTPLDKNNSETLDGKEYNVINYPIDGKDAVTLWRIVQTVTTKEYGKLSLLHCRPKTGRNHQIRRHLSYCLDAPIVGDNKYDGGGHLAKETRKLGLFLCSNRIECVHAIDKSNVSVEIPLPEKFSTLLGRKEVVI